MKRLIIIISIVLVYMPVFGAITSISDNTPTDGQSIIIYDSGSGFGTNSLSIEWLGPNIENGINGTDFSATGWDSDATSSTRQSPLYSTTRYHSGAQSILCSTPVETQYTSAFYYDKGSLFTNNRVFVTWWVYIENLSCDGDCAGNSQWKLFRITPNASGGGIYSDQQGCMYWTQQVAAPDATFVNGNYMAFNFCKPNDGEYAVYDATCYAGSTDIYRDNGTIEGYWTRIDGYFQGSSSGGTSDGTFNITLTILGGSEQSFFNYDNNTVTYTDSESTYGYQALVWENYLGNGLDYADIYIDDVYFQEGTWAHVEIGDAQTWANCTHKEIQYPTSWASGAITFTANQGSFSNGTTAYIWVIGDDGVPTDQDTETEGYQGYQITLTGSAPEAPPTLDRITIVSDGNSTQFDFSENMQVGTDAYSGWTTLTLSGGAVTLTNCGITNDVVECDNSRTVGYGESFTSFSYTQPGDGLQDTAGTPNNLETISSYAGAFSNDVPNPGSLVTVFGSGTSCTFGSGTPVVFE